YTVSRTRARATHYTHDVRRGLPASLFRAPSPSALSTLSLHDALPICKATLFLVGALAIGKLATPFLYRQAARLHGGRNGVASLPDRKSTRLNSSHSQISYAVFCLKKKKKTSKTT